MFKKETVINKLIAGGVGLIVLTVALTFLIFIHTFYTAYKNEMESDCLIKNQIIIPKEATNLKIIGEDWYTFELEGKTILLHKKVSYLTGTSAESMTTL